MRLPLRFKGPGVSLGAAIAAYAAGVAFAVTVTGYGVHRVASALAAEFSPPSKAPVRSAAAQAAKQTMGPTRGGMAPAPQLEVVREAAMTPTQSWGGFSSRSYRYSGSPFGSSSRSQRGFFGSLFGFDDQWDRPRDTYRTLCVRLCDGYYFPVSFSATPDRFERDRQVCENSCGSQARLFVYRNPGGQIEDMQDLRGQPYRKLKTAYLYRTEYVADCKCQPHPWEQQALDRHRTYALVAAKRRGDKEAIAELAALVPKTTRQEKRAGKTAALSSGPTTDHRVVPGLPLGVPQSITEAEQVRLGTEARRTSRLLPDKRKPQSYPNRANWAPRSQWQPF